MDNETRQKLDDLVTRVDQQRRANARKRLADMTPEEREAWHKKYDRYYREFKRHQQREARQLADMLQFNREVREARNRRYRRHFITDIGLILLGIALIIAIVLIFTR